MITQARLKELLHYDPDTGVFTWRVNVGSRAKAGAPAGTKCESLGYYFIRIDNQRRPAHRLAFLYMEGALPVKFVDHINGDGFDNRWTNLRHATPEMNSENQRAARGDNKSTRLLGAYPNGKRYCAKITVKGKVLCLGTYDTPEEAHQAYLTAKRELHAGCTI